MQGLLQRGITEDLTQSKTELNQYVTLRQVYDLRRKQAEKLREEADLVINCERTQAAYAGLQNDLQLLDSDIHGYEKQASMLLASIGVK